MSLSDEKRTGRKRVVVGVAGGIAAYKAATVVRQLAEAGHSVRVIPTESALRFVGAAPSKHCPANRSRPEYSRTFRGCRTSLSARVPT